MKIKIPLDNRSYYIKIGEEILKDFPEELKNTTKSKQVILVSNDVVYPLYGDKLKQDLKKKGFDILTYLLPDGEEYKTWQMAEKIITAILARGFNRDAIMVALGGGVVGDIAGFVASIYQRGIKYVQIPTTLLAQVDSSVGGKVAVNHPLAKNMIGSFYQPLAVWTDLKTLSTLPEREWRAGLAEVIKYGVIWDEEFFSYLENNALLITQRNKEVAKKIIARSCEIKARIVGMDERENSLRAILNFGHTIGHALESITGYNKYRHGEAVAIGMVSATSLAVSLRICPEADLERLIKLLEFFNLPVKIPVVPLDKLVDKLYLDKKVKERELVFVLPQKIGKVEILKGIKPQTVLKILQKSVGGNLC